MFTTFAHPNKLKYTTIYPKPDFKASLRNDVFMRLFPEIKETSEHDKNTVCLPRQYLEKARKSP